MANLILFNNVNLPNARRDRHHRENIDPVLDNYSDEELRSRYRFGRKSIQFLVDLCREGLQRNSVRNHALSVSMQICIALRFYASGSFLQVIGDTVGLDKSTVSRVVRNVSLVLVSKRNDFIRWPATDRQRNSIKQGFYDIGRFPNVIGAVDGTHVRIIGPSENENAFVNRKGYHSINVQGICDHTGQLINVAASWPGASHDSHVFRSSQLGQHLEQNFNNVEEGILLGDSGYACRPFLMTPYLHPDSNPKEAYNSAHKKTRVTVERVFGWWKRRFHVLHSEIRMSPVRVCTIIGACAVLHNISIQLHEPIEDAEFDDHPIQDHVFVGHQDGAAIREYLVNQFFT